MSVAPPLKLLFHEISYFASEYYVYRLLLINVKLIFFTFIFQVLVTI